MDCNCLYWWHNETKGNYSFTLTISESKVIYFKGKRLPYGMLTNQQQYEFLENHLNKISKFKGNAWWVYELHKPNKYPARLHIHGYVINTSQMEMDDFISAFYGNPIQIAYNGYVKLCKVERTYFDSSFWETYCEKHQKDIIYHMGGLQQKKESAELDGKQFKITIDTNKINAQYLNSLEEHLESKNMGDEYLFGKINKFIVDL